jgi:DNA invertase Pin-like site-specific DNA recombinase
MSTEGVRAATYLRVSRDDQTTDNQRLVLVKVAEHRGWIIVQTYEDQGISGAKGRDQRPAFDRMLKDAVRRRFDILMVWSIDRLVRSVLHVVNALAELDAAGVALYSDQQAIDSTTPSGRAMIQMASVFGEQERQIIRSRVNAGLDRVRAQGKKLGRPKVSPKTEDAIRRHLSAGNGILKVAALVGCGSGAVQRVKREMVGKLVTALAS